MGLDARAFTDFERRAHDTIAGSYAEGFTKLTRLALEPLLDAAEIGAGQAVLDIATGPGLAAAAARDRGAKVIGLDISEGMVARARAAHPGMEFRVADVTALPFADGGFDAVICNFGLGHFPEPEAALHECIRVLASGGRLVFTWWDMPERQRLQGLFRETVEELGLPPPPGMPPGHDVRRFSDRRAFAALLNGAGLGGTSVSEHGAMYVMPDAETVWQTGLGGMAVTGAAITAQDAATQARAREVLARRAEAYRTKSGLELPVGFLVGQGRRLT